MTAIPLEYPAQSIVWREGCMINVPRMTVTSTKLIGHHVVLHVRGSREGTRPPYYYTGLVTLVTRFAVSMVHVRRYTEIDFKVHQEQQRSDLLAGDAWGTDSGQCNTLMGSCGSAVASGGSERDTCAVARGVAPRKGRNDTSDVKPARDRASSALTTRCQTVPVEASRGTQTIKNVSSHKVYAANNCSMSGEVPLTANLNCKAQMSSSLEGTLHSSSDSYLPFMTINRSRLISARFGRDPRSSFYSLFQDPSRQILDMQYLRMFVRQYLVHVSEGDKVGCVDLYSFVTVRGACPSVDVSLLKRVAFEELPVLLNADHRRRPRVVTTVPTSTHNTNAADATNVEVVEVSNSRELSAPQVSVPPRPTPRRKKDTCCDCFGLFTLEYRSQES